MQWGGDRCSTTVLEPWSGIFASNMPNLCLFPQLIGCPGRSQSPPQRGSPYSSLTCQPPSLNISHSSSQLTTTRAHYLFICLLGRTRGTLGLHLAFPTGITSDSVGKLYGVLGIEPRSVTCNASILSTGLSQGPAHCFLSVWSLMAT